MDHDFTSEQYRELIQTYTQAAVPPLVPEIRLYLAEQIVPIWEATERWLGKKNVPPPFWAFCWPGGQVLARYILDRPEIVQRRRVLDFAAGGGIVAIAAAQAGAASAVANDIDALAMAVAKANAELNHVAIDLLPCDLLGTSERRWDVILAGDICYEKTLAERVKQWLWSMAARGVTVLIGDPGRTYLPDSGLVRQAQYLVPTTLELENMTSRNTSVLQVVVA